MSIEKKLNELLISNLQPTELMVENESHKHAGHAGHIEAGGGSETHFNVIVVSSSFDGQSRVMRQRAVNTLAKPLFDEGLHALALKTYTPQEWDALRSE